MRKYLNVEVVISKRDINPHKCFGISGSSASSSSSSSSLSTSERQNNNKNNEKRTAFKSKNVLRARENKERLNLGETDEKGKKEGAVHPIDVTVALVKVVPSPIKFGGYVFCLENVKAEGIGKVNLLQAERGGLFRVYEKVGGGRYRDTLQFLPKDLWSSWKYLPVEVAKESSGREDSSCRFHTIKEVFVRMPSDKKMAEALKAYNRKLLEGGKKGGNGLKETFESLLCTISGHDREASSDRQTTSQQQQQQEQQSEQRQSPRKKRQWTLSPASKMRRDDEKEEPQRKHRMLNVAVVIEPVDCTNFKIK